jgi:hypothetical protein
VIVITATTAGVVDVAANVLQSSSSAAAALTYMVAVVHFVDLLQLQHRLYALGLVAALDKTYGATTAAAGRPAAGAGEKEGR